MTYDGFTFVVRFREVDSRLEVWSLEVNVTAELNKKPRRLTASGLRFRWADIIHKAAEWHLMRTQATALQPKDEADADALNPFRGEARELGFSVPIIEPVTPKEAAKIDEARRKLARA